jgi:tRNA uridine 5-carbamoylmethylation protein Kti12
MKIIALRGYSNSGKTTTLNKLYDELVNNQGYVVHTPQQTLPGNDDFECILENDGQKVAIFTLGDYIYALGLAMGYYSALGVNTLVIADSNKKYYISNPLFNSREFDKNYIVVSKNSGGSNPAQQNIEDDNAIANILKHLP